MPRDRRRLQPALAVQRSNVFGKIAWPHGGGTGDAARRQVIDEITEGTTVRVERSRRKARLDAEKHQ